MLVNEALELGYNQLRSAYQEAWRRYSNSVSAWRLALPDTDRKNSLVTARRLVEASELSYREHRNALAAFIFSHSVNAAALRKRVALEVYVVTPSLRAEARMISGSS